MDIARHLALVDELCSRPFPAEHGPSAVGAAAPRAQLAVRHHLAVLRGSHGLRGGDGAERAVTVEQFEKERDAVEERLSVRWGRADPLNLQTILLRTEHEGEIPEPWAGLSVRARVAWLWEAVGTGRWIAVAVTDRDEEDEVQLVAVVTQTPPP
ncbi:hypothetical protein [Streptomyces ziwulingensis]|uniref:Uncharacterized protein n=1 Tax=Streptomyces ziwulingensis TaxID=1045501 RepID=A0ABP9CPG9_9ACTN